MEGEPQDHRSSERETKLLIVRKRLEHIALFERTARSNERLKRELAEQKAALERELADLEHGEEHSGE